MVDTTERAWLDRVRRAVERLRKEVEAHPSEAYYQLCLRGWEQELQQLEQQQEHTPS
jgi:hypothetical protein